jgi:2,4-dienoyl-CoA reductase-like NADH-dependent reductase (Old Yellow Enzyme family)
LRNRFVKAGTYEGMTLDNQATAAFAAHHAGIAHGGTALTTTGYVAVSADGRTFPSEMYPCEENLGSLRAVTHAVHDAGSLISLQLGHCGTMTRTPQQGGRRPGGPSKTLNLYGAMAGGMRTRELSEADMRRIADEFVNAALLGAQAGFDAIEVHMGHGYLLSQFLSPIANKRTDQYGGGVENRIRYPAEVAERVLAAVGSRMAVIVKLNLRDGARGGVEIEDSIALARRLEQIGVHALVLSGGFTPHSPMYLFRGASPAAAMLKTESSRWNRFLLRLGARTAFRSMPFSELYFLDLARQVRAATQIKLGLLGGVRRLDNVVTAMAEGFDLVVLGRPLIAQPDLIDKFSAGDTRPSICTNCNECVAEFSAPGGVRCVLRPQNDVALNRVIAS